MNFKLKKNILFLIIISGLILSCRDKNPDDADSSDAQVTSDIEPIPKFFDKNVVLATGVDFQTGEPVVLDPITGELLNPLTDIENNNCNLDEVIIYSDNQSEQESQKQLNSVVPAPNTKAVKNKSNSCDTRIVNPDQELANAIKSSDKIINGTLRVNGKDIPARFVISVTALFEGSNCAYFIAGGNQYSFCSNTQTNCNLVRPRESPNSPRYAFSSNESYRRAVRKVCRSFPDWKTSDCNYLKTRFRTFTEASGHQYSIRYKQYIWKTCKNNDQLWGTCPPPVSNDSSVSECVNPVVTP